MQSFKKKRIIISGGSRGIGLAIAKRMGRDGARVAILAKTQNPHPKLKGTIFSAAKEIEEAGGFGLPIVTDVRDENAIQVAVEKTVETFGGLDACINNAGAIFLNDTSSTNLKRFDLMFDVNVRATFALSKFCIPHLLRGKNPHILNICPPPFSRHDWFSKCLAYSMSKMGMSQCVIGMSNELKTKGIAVNALWPHSIIATDAVGNILGGPEALSHCRKPEIMADACAAILEKKASNFTGRFCIDDILLFEEGMRDFSQYRVDATKTLWGDLFIPDDIDEVEPIIAMNWASKI